MYWHSRKQMIYRGTKVFAYLICVCVHREYMGFLGRTKAESMGMGAPSKVLLSLTFGLGRSPD